MSAKELEMWEAKFKDFSLDDLLHLQESLTQELRRKTATLQQTTHSLIDSPGRFGQPKRLIAIPGAYQPTSDEIEAELNEVFTPQERAEMVKTNLKDLPPLPVGAKTAAQLINEDREDRF